MSDEELMTDDVHGMQHGKQHGSCHLSLPHSSCYHSCPQGSPPLLHQDVVSVGEAKVEVKKGVTATENQAHADENSGSMRCRLPVLLALAASNSIYTSDGAVQPGEHSGQSSCYTGGKEQSCSQHQGED